MKPEQLIKLWRDRTLQAELPFAEKWSWKTLRTIDRELAQLLREQVDLFDEACVTGTPAEVAEQGAALVRGYEAAVRCLTENDAMVEELRVDRLGPSLQDLVEKSGGWDKITDDWWAEYERARAIWRAKLINGEFDLDPRELRASSRRKDGYQ